MAMKIDGLVSEAFSKGSGDSIRLYPEGRSKQRFIKVERPPTGTVRLQLIEGTQPPGLDPGEDITLAKYDENIVDRLVRAMASLHFGIVDAETGHTAIDRHLLSRGFDIRFSKTGSPHWSRSENGLTYEIAKTGGNGLPAHSAAELQAKVTAPFNASVVITAPNLHSLMTFVEMKAFLSEMQPNTSGTFTLVEDAFH
jgi:hypothetical protein